MVLAFCMQYGAGLYVYGTATLIDSNIYSNVYVSVGNFRTKLDSSAPLDPCARSSSAQNGYGGQGGGLLINDGGVANLDGCNVFSNEASVRARLMPLP